MRKMFSKKQIEEIAKQSGSVVANPTLAGTEDALTGLQVGDTKYAVSGGHCYIIYDNYGTVVEYLSDNGNITDKASLIADLNSKSYTTASNGYLCLGDIIVDGAKRLVFPVRLYARYGTGLAVNERYITITNDSKFASEDNEVNLTSETITIIKVF